METAKYILEFRGEYDCELDSSGDVRAASPLGHHPMKAFWRMHHGSMWYVFLDDSTDVLLLEMANGALDNSENTAPS